MVAIAMDGNVVSNENETGNKDARHKPKWNTENNINNNKNYNKNSNEIAVMCSHHTAIGDAFEIWWWAHESLLNMISCIKWPEFIRRANG